MRRKSIVYLLMAFVCVSSLPAVSSAAADTTAPVTSARIIGHQGLDGWWRDATIAVTATDSQSYLAWIDLYKPNGLRPHSAVGIWNQRSWTRYFPLEGLDGAYTLKYRAADVRGNVSPWRSLYLKLDTHPAYVGVVATNEHRSTMSAEQWTQRSITARPGRCYDAASGCLSWTLWKPSGAVFPSGTSMTLTAEGRHTFRSWAQDRAGGIGRASYWFGIDRHAPAAAMTTGDGQRFITRSTIRLTGTASDPRLTDGTAGSGVRHVAFDIVRRMLDGSRRNYSGMAAHDDGNGNWSVDIELPTGTYDVRLYSQDAASNASFSAPITIDVIQLCADAPPSNALLWGFLRAMPITSSDGLGDAAKPIA
jgi:hypothetical protein